MVSRTSGTNPAGGPALRITKSSKNDPKINHFLMPLRIGFWMDFKGLPKSSQVGTIIGSKMDVNFAKRFSIKTKFFFGQN